MLFKRRLAIIGCFLVLMSVFPMVIFAEDQASEKGAAPVVPVQNENIEQGKGTGLENAQGGNSAVDVTEIEPPLITLLPPETYGTAITVQWVARGASGRYLVQLSTDFGFLKGVITKEVGNVMSLKFDGLSGNTVYYFRVGVVETGEDTGKPGNGKSEIKLEEAHWSAITRTKCLAVTALPGADLPKITGINPGVYFEKDNGYYCCEKNPAVMWSFTRSGPAPVFTGIAGGNNFSLALSGDGTVWSWGVNNYGQLGDGSTVNRLIPAPVKGVNGTGVLNEVVAIAARTYYAVALKRDGTVWAWGRNDYGQLGDGTTLNKSTPVQVKGTGGAGFLTEIVAVTVGNNHTLALKKDGTVWAWGYNIDGRLGDGSMTNRSTPVQVKGPSGNGFLTEVMAITAGYRHSVALKKDGAVLAWGYNADGQLGNGVAGDRNMPSRVKGGAGTGFLTDIKQIAAGKNHTVALKSDGTVWTWGINETGQLGDGTKTNRNTPVKVWAGQGKEFSGAVAVTAGAGHTLILKSDGTLWAFGDNTAGQCGNGTTANTEYPVQVKGPAGSEFLTGCVTVTGGSNHTLAIGKDGSVLGWGGNEQGQLGNGGNKNESCPVMAIGTRVDELRVVECKDEPGEIKEYSGINIDPAKDSAETKWELPDGRYAIFVGMAGVGAVAWSEGKFLVIDTKAPVIVKKEEEIVENTVNIYFTSDEPVKYELYVGSSEEDLQLKGSSSDYIVYDGTENVSVPDLDLAGGKVCYRIVAEDKAGNSSSSEVYSVEGRSGTEDTSKEAVEETGSGVEE